MSLQEAQPMLTAAFKQQVMQAVAKDGSPGIV